MFSGTGSSFSALPIASMKSMSKPVSLPSWLYSNGAKVAAVP